MRTAFSFALLAAGLALGAPALAQDVDLNAPGRRAAEIEGSQAELCSEPRDRPVARSMTTAADSQTPLRENACRRSASVAS